MAKYFTFDELIRSTTAKLKGIDNIPPPEIKVKLTSLANNLLDPIRELWGKPIHVNSGFRCKILNDAIKGSPNSQHMKGEAADITTGSKEGNKRLFLMIQNSEIAFDQLIDESEYAWLHVSYRVGDNRRNILHL